MHTFARFNPGGSMPGPGSPVQCTAFDGSWSEKGAHFGHPGIRP